MYVVVTAQHHALFHKRGHLWQPPDRRSNTNTTLAVANDLDLASIPLEFAELNVLERQLIARIFPFAKLVKLPEGQQSAIHGSVVCVPSEMKIMVNSPQRKHAETQLLQVKQVKVTDQLWRTPSLLHRQHEKCFSRTDEAKTELYRWDILMTKKMPIRKTVDVTCEEKPEDDLSKEELRPCWA